MRRLIFIIAALVLLGSCTKENYSDIYPQITKYNGEYYYSDFDTTNLDLHWACYEYGLLIASDIMEKRLVSENNIDIYIGNYNPSLENLKLTTYIAHFHKDKIYDEIEELEYLREHPNPNDRSILDWVYFDGSNISIEPSNFGCILTKTQISELIEILSDYK